MNKLTRHIQDDVLWCILFTDDIVLIDETTRVVNVMLKIWMETLESNFFKISRNDTEYMEYEFSMS